MNKKLLSFIGILVFYSAGVCLGQSKLVSVNPVTGTASVAIPLYNIVSGAVSTPIEAVYSATGVKPKDVEGTAGMSWQLVAGGSISRQVRGLPDDIKTDNAGNTLLGWMYNSNESTIRSFGIANNGSTCSDETADISYITTHFGNLYDTQPDIFYVNAPGLSCQLVYDQSISGFRPIPYQDLVITYKADTTSGLITSFTITNDKGIKYLFSVDEPVSQYTINPASPVNYFNNTYTQYKNGIYYYDSWFLSSITDITGQGVLLLYTTAPPRSSTDSVNLYIGGSSTKSLQYEIKQTVTPMILSTLNIDNEDDSVSQKLTFNWTTNSGTYATNQTVISSIAGMGDTIDFNYTPVVYTGNPDHYTRYFLSSVTDGGCSSPVNYRFSYVGQVYGGGYSTTPLGDSTSRKFDYWGYFNNLTTSVPAVYVNPLDTSFQRYAVHASNTVGTPYIYTIGTTNSVADTANVMAGTLDTIFYAQGGMTTLTYQSNDYLDSLSNAVNYGGGIRVRQITDYDGMSPANNIVRTYAYVDSLGHSSGRPVSLPAYAFTIPYTGGATGQPLWAYSTAISDRDLSTEDHTIMYSDVRESRTGAGSILYQYYNPATNWDRTAECFSCSTPDWLPTKNYVGRTNCSDSYGQVRNDIYSYPFVPNINYDFERGLLKKVTTYNSGNSETSESDYTYQRSYSTATAIPALQFDYNSGTSGVLGYSKYNVYTRTSELTSQVTKKVFDSNSLGQSQQSTVKYYYDSHNHKLLTQQRVTNSDNTVLINNINYTKDFTTADSGSNLNATAVYKLIQENINIPVETWSQVVRGGTTYTTGANLTLFSPSAVATSPTHYLPSQQFIFTAPDGDSAFTPFTISGQTCTKYSGYPALPAANYTQYDNFGTLQTMDDGHHHEQSSIKDYYSQKPAIAITNAASTEAAFNDFDSQMWQPFNLFTLSGTTSYVSPGHTGQGAVFTTSQTLSSTAVTKNIHANNYIFSIWIKSASSGSITLTLTPSSGSPHSYAEAFPATGSAWQYFEWKIPVSNITTATFTPSVTTSANIDIDDIIFYPDISEVTTYSYDPVTHFQTSMTNTNGISTYYSYDKWGRPLYVYDRYKNILKRDNYVNEGEANVATGSIGIISVNPSTGPYTTTTSITFGCGGTTGCIGEGTFYIWDFGDGSPKDTTNVSSASPHTYVDTGTYVVTVTIFAPLLGTFTGTKTMHITPTPVNLIYTNTTTAHGVVYSMNFYQDGVLKYNVTPGNVSTMKPLQGVYTVEVMFTTDAYQYVPATGEGYQSIALSATGMSQCQNYSSAYSPSPNFYTFLTVDLTHLLSLYFTVSTSSCP